MAQPPQVAAASSLFDRLAQAPAVQSLVRRLERGGALRAAGISAPAQPCLAALLQQDRSPHPLVIVADSLKTQEWFQQDVTTWLQISASPSPNLHPPLPTLFYPAWEILPHEAKLPHADVISERLETLIALAGPATRGSAPHPLVVTNVTALLQRTFPSAELARRTRALRRGDRTEPLDLVEWLEEQGYEPEAQVTAKGELALRGGILDVFPPTSPWPVRLEFFGDELESLREFDPLTQISRDEIAAVTLPPAGELGILKQTLGNIAGTDSATGNAFATLLDYLPNDTVVLLAEPEALEEHAAIYASQVPAGDPFFVPWAEWRRQAAQRGLTLVELGEAEPLEVAAAQDAGTPETIPLRLPSLDAFRPLTDKLPEPHVAEAQRREFFHQLHRWLRQDYAVHVFCNNDGERQRFTEIWQETELDEPNAGPTLHLGSLARGFICDDARLVVVTDAEIFGRYKRQQPRRLKSAHAQAARSALDIDFTDLEEGDLVVHLQHGIGRFLGLKEPPATVGARKSESAPQKSEECLVIEYAPASPEQPAPRLYVPVTEAHLVSKYVGVGKVRPPLNTLGGTRWQKAKEQAERAVRDVAAELLRIQAARESQAGFSFGPDTSWQREFEAAFVFEETPDQWRAIQETKTDMERPKPMDRLICGDVGFGKTEVAIRAAFKAVMTGKQVAVLVPTTVLAQQHFNTFRERMADYPVRVELLSRFRSRRAQQKVIEDLATGAVDIVIGTHRLVQSDVVFKDLGLVVIDEEQRFGVLHKEKFKRLRTLVDVLTLSATPIPRTLYLALTGARDMSTIQTPPQDRLPVETIVTAYDERLIRDAILRELNRGGQVFFLHNRVMTIETMAAKLRALVPQARIIVGHGQMHADDLEEVMTAFINGEADVLLSTTIIESGLDIPNANTIIIDRADRFGLSDLYQLRGRVGRYKHQAYAYLLIPRHAGLLSDARKRISAMKQYATLGSGFKIAMRDLEIRGAGNLLGAEQSGHITAVGFELYCDLLKHSIAALKGEKVKPRVAVEVRLDFLVVGAVDEPFPSGETPDSRERASHQATLPHTYIPEPQQRIEIYRKLAQAADRAALAGLQKEVRDRFGPLPPPVAMLLLLGELKLLAAERGITAVEVRDDKLMLTRHGDFVQVGGKFPRLTKKVPEARLKEIRRLLQAI
ncbi:MAG TPA: transcription-repair coupling factor [Verrucomicrobiae bacterium]|nr:transcription-repair coupling factor [Verrucomicrobiae bacterium]